ncbi:MAG: carboxypeptidase-like regulatory domain-containing protein, partial [Alphaproteobacteria bacterium]|nr:carboxypeptidase-like regulatory domain-containing protein [Alphaproteobacteria bacterium]
MKKIFILFAIFSLQIAPTFADENDLRRGMDASDIILKKYCASRSGNRLDCRTNQTSTSISGGCSEWKPDADKEQFLVDLRNWCNKNYDAISPETKPATATINTADTTATSDAANSTPATGTMTVSGTIMIPTIDGQGTEPAISATVLIDGTTTGATADLDGNFTLPNVPANTSLKIEYVGCTDKILPAENDMGTITLDCGEQLDEVVVVACAGDKANGIRKKENIDGVCYPTECLTPRWKLSGTGKDAKCIEQKCLFENGTGEWVADGDSWTCKLKSCNTDKGWKPNADGTACIEMLKECTDDQKKQHPDALSTGIKKDTEDCVATECKCGFDLTDGKCVAWPTDGVACNDTQNPKLPSNASAGTKQCDGKSAYCTVSACADGFKISDDKKSCISTRGDSCDATSVDKNATAGTNQNVNGKITCVITACGRGFKPNKNGTKCIAAELSEQDSLAKIDELKDNAQKMRDKERSTENKLLGAAGIGATGIGAMQMLSASAEQSADQDAEAAMRAYLATFHCNYGMGKNIAGGEKQVELPGGNELIGLYAEYVNLANDLKIRKNALGMRAGIESEPILDSAASGLYDDIAIGKTSGAYTSLARAIMDPTGADAIAWAAQKSDSADKLKSGAITAGVGALGSLVGNLAINSGDAKKNKVNDIIAEFDKKKQKIFQDLESDIKKIPTQVEKCPAGTTGTKHPNCTCTGNAEYNTNTKSCDPCADGQTIVEGKCTCTGDTPLWDEQNKKCIKQPQ